MHNLIQGELPIYYWPNGGNLGDLLIAEATRQFFSRKHISWKEYDPSQPPTEEAIKLVYGGGGRFVSHWSKGLDEMLTHLLHPRVKEGIILPHSFFNVDDFVKRLDNRYTILCRDAKSFNYLKSLSLAATVSQENDMGMHLSIDELPPLSAKPSLSFNPGKEEIRQCELLEQQWTEKVIQGIKNSTHTIHNKKIAFVLRTDKEKSFLLSSPFSYDISLAWSSSCRKTAYSSYFIRVMAEALSYPDIVVTDRLHVGIMAYHLGKTVYLLDNDYGKTSGVYQQSLNAAVNVHMLNLRVETWPEELYSAWMGFNSPHKIFEKVFSSVDTRLKHLERLNQRLDGQMNRQDAQRKQIAEVERRLDGQMNRQDAQRKQIAEVERRLDGQMNRQDAQRKQIAEVERRLDGQMNRQDAQRKQIAEVERRLDGQMNRQDAQRRQIAEVERRLDGQMARQDTQQQKMKNAQRQLDDHNKRIAKLDLKLLSLCPEHAFLLEVYEVVIARMKRRARRLKWLALLSFGKKKSGYLEERRQLKKSISRVSAKLSAMQQ